ncbi:hypothetical protein OF83DRAFT_1284684 [Amylostereum chailletii]|nr:hypothetical protein OF83DRAFT_1284684 [Amylostereum chailletii]
MEDEIQYLGRMSPTLGPTTTTSTPAASGARRSVSGIVLSVLSDENPLRTVNTLQYFKSQTKDIFIGRASSSGGVARTPDNKVSFHCPVVSRSHAKIVFSSNGRVYISDLVSHHGTYVRKMAETTPQKLFPEVATEIEDGDSVTFGKAVAKDDGYVYPVTVGVRTLYENDPPPSPFSLSVTSQDKERNHSKPPSGRYGVYDLQSPSLSPASSSASLPGSPSFSDRDSDEAPEEFPIYRDSSLTGFSSLPMRDSSLPSIRGLGLLKRFLPSHDAQPSFSHMFNSSGSRSPSIHDIFEDAPWRVQQPQEELASFASSSNHESFNPFAVDPFVIGAYPDSPAGSPVRSPSPFMSQEEIAAVMEPFLPPADPAPIVVHEEDESAHSSDEAMEPVVAGDADLPPPPQAVEPEVEEPEDGPEGPVDMDIEVEEHVVPVEDRHRDDASMASVVDVVEAGDDYTVLNTRLTALNEAIVTLRGNVLRDHIAHRKTQTDQRTTFERLSDLDKRAVAATNLANTLRSRLETSTTDLRNELLEEIGAINDRMDVVETSIKKLNTGNAERAATSSQEILATREMLDRASRERDAVKAGMSALEALVTEMRGLRDGMLQSRAEQLDEFAKLKAMHTEASTLYTSTSLKRKRDIVEDEESEDAPVLRPQTKRSRTGAIIVSGLAHTAVAASIGAVAVWSALAFS